MTSVDPTDKPRRGAIVDIGPRAQTPVDVTAFGWHVDRFSTFALAAKTTIASRFAAAIVVRDYVLQSVGRIETSTDPGDR